MLLFCLGVILGFITCIIIFFIVQKKTIIYGNIDVNEETGLCRVRITDYDIMKTSRKKAMFIINHNVDIDISRDEQLL